MPERIVNGLKMVQVDQHHKRVALGVVKVLDQLRQTVDKVATVVEAGQMIMRSLKTAFFQKQEAGIGGVVENPEQNQ